jgi:septum formation protein
MVNTKPLGETTGNPQDIGLILASGSPRRRELLTRAGIEFETRPADIPEVQRPNEPPAVFAKRLAREKALAVAQRIGGPARPVLGADTIVVIDDRVLGKPTDSEHAVELLSLLIGRRHAVITGVAVVNSETLSCRDVAVESWVVMRGADRQELVEYAAGGEPLDKAGAYALQGEGRRFIERVEGSETNVIGLPVEETLALLRDASPAVTHSGATRAGSPVIS